MNKNKRDIVISSEKSNVNKNKLPRKINKKNESRGMRDEMYLPNRTKQLLPDMNIIGSGEGEVIRVNQGVDRILLVVIMILVCFGSIMVFSASYADAQSRYGDSYYFIKRQMLFVGLGLGGMFAASKFPMKFYRYMTIPAYIATLGLLVVVLLMGLVGGGAQRWIQIGPVTFQPSEAAKLTLVMMLAWYYTTFQEAMKYKSWNLISKNPEKRKGELKLWFRANFTYGIFIPGCIIMAVVLLVALEKHLSGIIILGFIGICVMFAAGCNGLILGGIMSVAGCAVAAFAFLTDYTKRRIDIWLSPESFPLDGGWQTLQGLNAIGSGGLFGLGLGASRQKYSYVSQPQNDFIFTIVCEELGFIGAVAVILLFAVFVWRGFVVAMRAESSYAAIVAIGITAKMAIQVLLNIAVVTNSIPNTGISLPFFSYGGSAILILFIEMGLLLNISKTSYQRK